MKTLVFLAMALLVAQGCLPERPAPVPPPPAAPSSDERALQTLTDLGVTPEIMLRLVRDQLTSPIKPDEPGQPVPAPIEKPAPPAEPAPAAPQPATPVLIALAPAPAVPSPAPAAPAVEARVVSAPPPAAEPPLAAVPAQPAAAAAATTIVLQQPVIIQQAQDFYAPLNSYGDWITLPAYGRVWQPAVTVVNAEWRPYYQGGRWIYTDCGWYWQSDYSWGWAVFHYGRWCYVDGHRWVWIPDTVWAPAWVSWRRSDTHCGWAPLPPSATFRVGVGFAVGQGVQFDVQFGLSSGHYTFVANNRLGEPNLASVIIHNDQVETVYRKSRHMDDSYTWNEKQRRVHNQGPDRDAEDRAHRPVARPIRFVPPPAAPVITPVLPAAPATPAASPVITPGRRPPRFSPSPAAPLQRHVPETRSSREAAVEPVPTTRRPDLHRLEPLPALVPRKEAAPAAPVAEPAVNTPISTQPARREPSGNYFQNIRREPRTAPVTPQETRTEPVTPKESKTAPVRTPEIRTTPVMPRDPNVEPVRTPRGEPVAGKALPEEKSPVPGSTDTSRSNDDDDTASPRRHGGFSMPRP